MSHISRTGWFLRRPWWKRLTLTLMGAVVCLPASAQTRSVSPKTPAAPREKLSADEAEILKVLAANPATSPYAFQTSRVGSRILLKGVVGTREIYDIAMRLAIEVTPLIDDRIVIDTSAIPRVAVAPAPVNLGVVAAQSVRYVAGLTPPIYPPPLFGPYEDPFWGFEPPLITYPPWWSAINDRRTDAAELVGPEIADPRTNLPANAVEMTIDPRGVAILRGTVPSENDKVAIGEKAASLQGVTDVVNLLRVGEAPEPQPSQPRRRTAPPPPPTPDPDFAPGPARPVPPPPEPMGDPAVDDTNMDDDSLQRRLNQSLQNRPLLKGTALQVSVREGVATLSGEVPSILEAMTAYRTAQQSVGIKSVVDRLRFTVPDDQRPNPLVQQGRPEDVEPYLLSQIRRQVGDQANIDRIDVNGDRLEIKGTVAGAADRERVAAILRSMPVLRGFQLQLRLVED